MLFWDQKLSVNIFFDLKKRRICFRVMKGTIFDELKIKIYIVVLWLLAISGATEGSFFLC